MENMAEISKMDEMPEMPEMPEVAEWEEIGRWIWKDLVKVRYTWGKG